MKRFSTATAQKVNQAVRGELTIYPGYPVSMVQLYEAPGKFGSSRSGKVSLATMNDLVDLGLWRKKVVIGPKKHRNITFTKLVHSDPTWWHAN